MAWPVHIKGIKNKIASVFNPEKSSKDDPVGLVTYNLPYELEKFILVPFSDTEGKTEMAINGLNEGGQTLGIHNGTDTVFWTASSLSGNWVFNSTDQAKSGTQSINASGTLNNDTASFTTPVEDISIYDVLAFSIYITSWVSNDDGMNVNFSFLLNGVQVSDILPIKEYIDITLLNQWQDIEIPLEDFNFQENDVTEFRVTTIDTVIGPPPNYYLDDILLQQTTGVEYTLKSEEKLIYKLYGIEISIWDSNGTATTGPQQFGNTTSLSNGLLLSYFDNNNETIIKNIKRNLDILQIPNTEIVNTLTNSSNVFIKYRINFPVPVYIEGRRGNRFTFLQRDNLTGIDSLTINGICTKLCKQNDLEYNQYDNNN